MTTVIAEYAHEPPLDEATLAARVAKLARCLEIREVKCLRSFVSFDGRIQFSVFEAGDAELVREAHRMVGMTFVRIVPVRDVSQYSGR
jgi:hypothetical protein